MRNLLLHQPNQAQDPRSVVKDWKWNWYGTAVVSAVASHQKGYRFAPWPFFVEVVFPMNARGLFWVL